MNDCFLPNSFSAKEDYFRVSLNSSEITDEVDPPWCLYPQGEFLGILIYCVAFTLASPTCLSVSI